MLPPLDLLAFFAPLLKKRDTYYVAVIVALGILWGAAVRRDRAKAVLLAERPTLDAHADQKTTDHEQRGAVVIVRKYLPAPPSACGAPPAPPVLAEERIEQAPSTIDHSREAVQDRHEAPACPAAGPAPWRYAGLFADPFQPSKIVGGRGAVTLGRNLELGVSARWAPHLEGQGEIGIRF